MYWFVMGAYWILSFMIGWNSAFLSTGLETFLGFSFGMVVLILCQWGTNKTLSKINGVKSMSEEIL